MTSPTAPRPCEHEWQALIGGDKECVHCGLLLERISRPVSPEAARCTLCGDPELYHNNESDHGFTTVPRPEAAPPQATNAPPVDPPIPHCPYCGKLSSSVAGAYAEPRCDHRCRERASHAPSRDSGALLEEIGPLLDAYGLLCFEHGERHPLSRAALTKIERHLSTLERDATRMREALTQIVAAFDADILTIAGRLDSPEDEAEARIGLAAIQSARAALAPSGEPTTTPETET